MSRVTLRTIAETTGLSKYAVSRALSGKSGVSEATRTRVQEVAVELGYQKPTPARTRPLGLMFDDSDVINGELYMQIQSGAQREAKKLGYDVKVHWTHNRDDLEQEARDSAGLLIVGPHAADSLARAYSTAAPIVRIGWLDPLEPVDLVGGTDHEAGSAVANYLLNLGHNKIAFVHGDPRYRGRMERLYGLREIIEQNAGALLFDVTWEADSSFAAKFDALHANGNRPTAFFCAHDGLAVTVVSELLSRGLRIPSDASVIGFGDFSAARQILPPLTTIRVAGNDFGAAAVRLLNARIRDPSFPNFPMRVLIPNTLIERGSVAKSPNSGL
jgi:LacI family transcriptional regulator